MEDYIRMNDVDRTLLNLGRVSSVHLKRFKVYPRIEYVDGQSHHLNYERIQDAEADYGRLCSRLFGDD